MSSSPQTDSQPVPATGEGEAAAFIKKWADKVRALPAAAVRVAMTVGETGKASSLLQTVESEEPGDESYKVSFSQRVGKIAADLSIGADTASTKPLLSNERISSRGVQVIGSGFIISREEARTLGTNAWR